MFLTELSSKSCFWVQTVLWPYDSFSCVRRRYGCAVASCGSKLPAQCKYTRQEGSSHGKLQSVSQWGRSEQWVVSLPTQDGCMQHNRLLPHGARSAKGITGLYQGFLPFLTIPLRSRQHFCCGTFSKNVTKQQFLSTLPQKTLALDFVLRSLAVKTSSPSLSSRHGAGESRADGWIQVQLKRSSCSQEKESWLLNGEKVGLPLSGWKVFAYP